MKQEIKDLIEISQFYGSQKEFVIAGGGNTSWKDQNRLYIKASGINLGQITERGFCILDRRELAELPGKTYSEDGTIREEQVKIDLLASRLDPGSGLRPSVETLLHNLIDYPFVVHTHSTWVNGLMCSQQAAEVSEEIFGKEFLFVPYSDPGYSLFKRILQQVNAYKEQYRKCPQVILVQNHGIFVAANTTDEVHKIYDDVLGKIKNRMATSGETEWFPVSEKIVNILPGLRMLLSEGSLKTATAFSSSWIRPFLTDKETFEKGIGTPFTPDQLVYCGSEYLFLESAGSEVTVMKEAEMQIAAFRHRKGCLPKVLFIRGEGVVVAENSTVSLDYVKDIVNDFCQISKLSENFGGPHPLTGHQMRFIENWEFEHYRKKVFLGSNPQGKVENKIILVTGAAQGFGAGIAELLFREGANVIVADVNDEKGSLLVESLNRTETKNRALFVKANVAEDASVRNMVRQTVIRFGGLDAMISNAGILYAGSLDEMDPETFEQITRVNYNGFFLCAKYAQSVMKRQHAYKPERFMDIIQINSKSGLQGSKKNFAYAGSKFGGIGLTQSFALELMPFRIKVNAICPGNYFDGPLWSDPQNGLFVQYLEAGKVPGAASIDEVKAYYESQVPAGRGCTPEDVVKAIFYVMDQEYETGQAVPVTGGQNMLK